MKRWKANYFWRPCLYCYCLNHFEKSILKNIWYNYCEWMIWEGRWRFVILSPSARGRCRTYCRGAPICCVDEGTRTEKCKCKMKKVFTAEQISDWFTSGASFANINIRDEVVGRKLDEPPSKGTRCVNYLHIDDSLKLASC